MEKQYDKKMTVRDWLLVIIIVAWLFLQASKVGEVREFVYDLYDPKQMYEDMLAGTGALYPEVNHE